MSKKKKSESKKKTGRKKSVAENDPPIIVSGGGGPDPNMPKPTGPFINVNFDIEGGPGRGTWKAKVDKTKAITGVEITFIEAGADPVVLKGSDGPFEISIQFTSD